MVRGETNRGRVLFSIPDGINADCDGLTEIIRIEDKTDEEPPGALVTVLNKYEDRIIGKPTFLKPGKHKKNEFLSNDVDRLIVIT